MAIPRGHRFPVGHDVAFPKGAVMQGDVEAHQEYVSRDEQARGRTPQQHKDEQTGKRIWKVTVTDPDEPKAKRASFDVFVVADVQPVPPTDEVLPGMRPIAFDGLEAEPKVAGQGEFKYQAYQFWATALVDPKAASGARSTGKQASAATGKEQAA